MKLRRLVLTVLLGLTVALGSGDALAQDAKEEARTYFNAGVQNYKRGMFLAAGQAFIEAHRLYRRPELSFSIAQAFRRQFQIDHKPRHLRVSVWYYRQYLTEVKKGGRRLEAVRGLSELTPHMAELGVEEMGPPPEVQFATSIMVSTAASGAVVSFDGGPQLAVGQSHEVKPGAHQAVVSARGFHPETRQLKAVEGRLVAIDIPLRQKPSLLQVDGADGADVAVDGRFYGVAPLPRPVELSAGRHFVTVTERGHEPHAQDLTFDPGESTTVTATLPRTDQRIGAQAVLGIGAATLAASGALAIAAVVMESEALSIRDAAQGTGTITEDDRLDHNEAVDRRDDLVIAAGVVGGSGAALLVTGLFLYLLDQPTIPSPPAQQGEPSERKPHQPPSGGIEVLAGPVLTPNVAGAGVAGRF